MAVKSIRDRVLLACVKAIHAKTICGRSATLCVAEIRIVLSNLAQSVTAFNSFSSNQSRETISSLLHVIGELCLAPLLQYKAKFDVQPFLTTLDVLSTAVLSLELIKNSFSDEYEDICIDLIDSLFFTDWHSDAVLPLANMLCELYSYVKSEHLQKLKVSSIY